MEVILASTSPYRRELLSRIGLTFECVSPHVDEAPLLDEWRSKGESPQSICEGLAFAKATAVAGRRSAAIVIGSDQLLEHRGELLGKPETAEAAAAQLARLAGGEHRLLTAWCVMAPQQAAVLHTVVSCMTMRSLAADEIKRYIAADQPLDCAGSYRWEARGLTLFDSIQTSDHSAIIGLPLLSLSRHLRSLGIQLP